MKRHNFSAWTVEMQLKILKQNFSYSEVPYLQSF